jgi:hypothetical protein
MASRRLLDDAAAIRAPSAVDTGDDLGELRRPSGPAAAVVLATGIACLALGVASVVTAASAAVSDALTLSERAGPVSGLSTVTAVVFFAAWGVLSLAWRRADPSLVRVAVVSAVLVAVGLLATFPPVFNAFGG